VRTNYNAPVVGAPLHLHGILALLGAQQTKLNANTWTFVTLGTPSTEYVHNNYPFVFEDMGRLAPMVVELVYRLAIWIVVQHSPSLGTADSRFAV
jgi:hypothetical protein